MRQAAANIHQGVLIVLSSIMAFLRDDIGVTRISASGLPGKGDEISHKIVILYYILIREEKNPRHAPETS